MRLISVLGVRAALAFAAIACASCPTLSYAGPCAEDLYKADIAINKRLGEIAAQGKGAAESTFATSHHQPTPATIAGAEEKVGDIPASGVEDVHKFMLEARQADDAGDKAACEKALAEAKTIVGLQ
jgi:hypothetical protein